VSSDESPQIHLGDNVLYPLPLRGGGAFLVDAGPDIAGDDGVEDTWTSLGTQLAAHGIEVGDVRFVLVTHAHLDHAGLAYRWAEAGTTVLAGADDVAAIAQGQASREAQRALQLADLERHGCPREVVEQMRSPRGRHPFGLRWEPCPADALESAGAAYELTEGRTLRVIDAPGHTPGNVVAFIPETGELFSGDTILPTTVPTPGMHYPQAIDGIENAPRWPSLPPFIESVSTLRKLGVRRVLPGHGEVVEEPERLFERFEKHHARRAQRVRAALEADGPMSVYDVAKAMFPRIPPRRLGQAITELLGHLDILEAAGEVEVLRDGEAIRYRLR
jgi:glyoxylase-like metal-dependent hydrolase (beta-lactamase superfamily II)